MGTFWQMPPQKVDPVAAPPADQDLDKTVGAFQNCFVPPVDPVPPVETPKKSTISKKLLIIGGAAVAGVILIVLLMLRSCGPTQDVPTEPPVASTTLPPTESTTLPPTESTTLPPTESTTAPTLPPEWSEWQDTLPDTVSADAYEIEEQILYRSRELETTTSDSKKMEGWELYDTTEAGAGYGAWSGWSTDAVKETSTRQVQTQTRYRYRNKETTTGSSASKDGWSLYNTTYAWSDYGAWSSWSTTAPTASDSRQVQSQTQYRYRTVTVTQEYTAWSSWSGWSMTRQSAGDLKKEESRTVWGYFYFQCPRCGAHMHISTSCYSWAGGCGYANTGSKWHEIWSPVSWSSAGFKDWHGTGRVYTYLDGQLVFKWTDSSSPKTQYRYATRSLQDVTNYGSWSSWSETPATASSTLQVETRTVYRYRDRSQIATYHFERWGGWSDWSTDEVVASDTRQVEKTNFYRYRDQVYTTTYWFRRWKEWSEFSTEAVTASDTIEVETKTQYRYLPKQ